PGRPLPGPPASATAPPRRCRYSARCRPPLPRHGPGWRPDAATAVLSPGERWTAGGAGPPARDGSRADYSGRVRVRNRWVILSVSMAAQVASVTAMYGVSFVLPQLRDAYGMTTAQAGMLAGLPAFGLLLTLLLWGVVIDRFGERATMAISLALTAGALGDRKSTRLNSSHVKISYAVFCLKK